ncbi:hypothetical protein FRC06_000686 [Ceratobasidium sp. 370]|nr:hypothetical protein FRC06_000686 [Ceratobasidium sp. 370]
MPPKLGRKRKSRVEQTQLPAPDNGPSPSSSQANTAARPEVPPEVPPAPTAIAAMDQLPSASTVPAQPAPHQTQRDDLVPEVTSLIAPNRFYDYPDISGVTTCSELRQRNLGIVTHWNFLCCLICPPEQRMVYFSKAREHIKSHDPSLPPSVTTNHISALLRKYNVVETDVCPAYSLNYTVTDPQQLHKVPLPQGIIAPLPFIDYFEIRKCETCEELHNPVHSYFRSRQSRSKHFNEKHGNYSPPRLFPDRVVWGQTFSPKSAKYRTWFEVDPNFVGMRRYRSDDDYEEATAYELAEAFTRAYRPAQQLVVEGEELREIIPFIYYIGWDGHVKNHDTEALRALVDIDPERDPLAVVYWAAHNTFEECQKSIPDMLHVYRWNLMDDESGSPKRPFQELTGPVVRQYGRAFARWVVFVCRLRQKMLNNDGTYPIQMTPAQMDWADNMLYYGAQTVPRRHSKIHLVLNLAWAFWHAQNDDYFEYIAANQFNDPTVRFACLINLRPTGEFDHPGACSSKIAHMKYIIRMMLYSWALQLHKDNGWSVSKVVEYIAPSISRRRVTPFAQLSYYVSHATNCANLTIAAPNVAWVSPHLLNLDGYSVVVKTYFGEICSLVRTYQHLVLEGLLLGLKPAQFNWLYDDETKAIYDSLWNTEAGYSAFEDKRNDFHLFSRTLGVEFSRHPPAAFLFPKRLIGEENQFVFREEGALTYLSTYNKTVETQGLLLQLTGGQPGRSAELTEMKWENTTRRTRGVVYPTAGYSEKPGRSQPYLALSDNWNVVAM